MGATTFMTAETGKTAQEAFDKAVAAAKYNYGNRGYTGSIAEKDSFVMVTLPAGNDPEDYADYLLGKEGNKYDKFGPAGCFELPEAGQYFFFGWASE